MSSRTRSWPPSGRGNAWRTESISSRPAALMLVASSSQPKLAFGVPVERTPERPVDDDHEGAHHHDTEHDAVEIARFGRHRDIGAEPAGLQANISPRCNLGDDAGVPRAA